MATSGQFRTKYQAVHTFSVLRRLHSVALDGGVWVVNTGSNSVSKL